MNQPLPPTYPKRRTQPAYLGELQRPPVPLPDQFLINGTFTGKEPATTAEPAPATINCTKDEFWRVWCESGVEGIIKTFSAGQLRVMLGEKVLWGLLSKQQLLTLGMQDIIDSKGGEREIEREGEKEDEQQLERERAQEAETEREQEA
jgi:hypothetical protein